MSVEIQVIFHSLYGHVYRLAEAIAEGARELDDVEAIVFQVAETLPAEVLEKMGRWSHERHLPTSPSHNPSGWLKPAPLS